MEAAMTAGSPQRNLNFKFPGPCRETCLPKEQIACTQLPRVEPAGV